MRESLLTIPISEIFEPKCGCPICRMRNMLETRTVEYIMGAAMMEPDVRLETNRLGFCHTHFKQMLRQKNRLSLALMLQTHIDEFRSCIGTRKGLFLPKKQRKISEINISCFVCSKVDWGMERLMVTFFEMLSDADFRTLFAQQEYICLPHYDLLTALAPSQLQKSALSDFTASLETLAKKGADMLYGDVSKFCSMYDYRSAGADWDGSEDAIERAITYLTGREPD